jgi:hypothetical protein
MRRVERPADGPLLSNGQRQRDEVKTLISACKGADSNANGSTHKKFREVLAFDMRATKQDTKTWGGGGIQTGT